MTRSLYAVFLLALFSPLSAEVTLSCDFTDAKAKKEPFYNFWSVHNFTERFSKKMRPAIMEGAKANLVRTLGGWPSGDRTADSLQWNGSGYVYDWTNVKRRIDEKLEAGFEIFQVVLDNPPWAFQRGFTLVDEADGKNFLKKDADALYGNSLPPDDAERWSRYIQALMEELIETYGKEKVLGWRFRVGTEIDTRPKHWAGTMPQFFDHYQNTVEAVHAVLPEAIVGAQFREASMKPKYADFRGIIEPPYGVLFIEWAKKNKVHYDFIGTSYYPRYTVKNKVNMNWVYDRMMRPIAEHPDWREGALFEVHEYKPITQIIDGRFILVGSSHAAAFEMMFAKKVYEEGIAQVFQWPTQHGGLHSEGAIVHQALESLIGSDRYQGTRKGDPEVAGNMIDALYGYHPEAKSFQVYVHNYHEKVEYQNDDKVSVRLKVPFPAGTRYKVKSVLYDRDSTSIEQFRKDHPKATLWESEGGWVKEDYLKDGKLPVILNEEGGKTLRRKRKDYTKYNKIAWSDPTEGVTEAGEEELSSMILFEGPLPSFSFRGYLMEIVQPSSE